MGGISQQLIEGISIIVNKAIKTADYARIRTGLITRINSNNTYDVEVDSKNLPEIPFMGTGVLATNSTVKVAFPDNQPNQAMILGVTNSGTPVSAVSSVNGLTGDVILNIPTKTSELTNDSGYLNSIPTEYVTDIEMQTYAQPKGDYATNSTVTNGLNTKLSLTGGIMTGNIDMGSSYINNIPDATQNQQPTTFKQLNDAIAGLGTVFDLKGSKLTVADLPSIGNKVGDVWYVESESVGYIWLKDSSGTLRWEKFGQQIDLSGYLAKADLLQSTGQIANNTMSQKAITDNLKANLNNPSLTGIPLAPTAPLGTNTTQIATTAFVKSEPTLSTINQQNPLQSIKTWVGTVAQYNAIQTKDSNTLYFMT